MLKIQQCDDQIYFYSSKKMKYTTRKFKIQMVPRTSIEKIQQHRNSLNVQSQKLKRQRYSNSIKPKSQSGDIFYPFNQCRPKIKNFQMSRAQKLLYNPQNCNLMNSKKQKQCRIFTDKCFDLLMRKKGSRLGFESEDQFKNGNILKYKQADSQNQKHISVHSMLNNIVDKFKSKKRKEKEEQNLQAQRLKTIQNQDVKITQSKVSRPNDRLTNEEEVQIYKMIRSTQLKTSASHGQCKINNSMNVRLMQSHKRILNFQSGYKDIHGLICVRLPFSEQPCLKRNLFTPQLIKTPQKTSARRKTIQISKTNKTKFMKFHSGSGSDQQYIKKLKNFLDFIFKINFSNKMYVSLQLLPIQESSNHKYKVFVGGGNNCLLVKSLLKRRFWLQIVDSTGSISKNTIEGDINFYWTQNKLDNIHESQNRSYFRQQPQEINTSEQISKRTIKLSDLKQLNQKILPSQKCLQIQKYIFKNGYQVPFQNQYKPSVITNHIPSNFAIGSKKNLFKSMVSYYKNVVKADPFQIIPKTYHVKSHDDPEFKKFVLQNRTDSSKVWILKPGENTNRGNGIVLVKFSQIQSKIKQKKKHANGQQQTYIIQSYINKPFLYNGRKFDIRHFMVLTSVNGILKAYWYRDGYIRTSSEPYDLQDFDQMIHLTNDAIQKNGQNYGKFEQGNKISYTQFQRYLDYTYSNKGFNFQKMVVSKMKQIITDVIKANYLNLDQDRKIDNFQIFGFDFMIDKDFHPYLIEINSNPCLQISCNLLSRIIPAMVQNSLRIGLDPLLVPKSHFPVNKRFNLSDNYLKHLRYELIFDQASLQKQIFNKIEYDDQEDVQDEYADEGKQVQDLQL